MTVKGSLRCENLVIEAETVYRAFNDSLASIAVAAIVWFGGGAVVQERP